MRIMFYARKIEDDMTSYRVHIFEVLNGLLKSGHTVIYADGQSYSIRKSPSNVSATLPQKTWLNNIKARILAGSFRHGVLFLWRTMYETKLFCLASITLLRTKADVIYWRNDMSFGGAILAKSFRLPSVVEVNGINIDEMNMNDHMDRFSFYLFKTAEVLSLKHSARYIVVTPQLKTVLHEEYGIPEDKIILIKNGANTEQFIPLDATSVKRRVGLKPDESYVCFVGELQQWSGVNNLIAALPAIVPVHPNVKVLIVGEGPAFEELRKQTESLAISDKIIFTGRVPYEKVPWYINASDICTSPATKARHDKIGGSALKICEYLSCSKPVVASRIGGNEIIEGFDCGYLVSPDEPKELASAIIKLLDDPAQRQAMGVNGRKYVLENCSWESIAKKVGEVCQEAIQHQNYE